MERIHKNRKDLTSKRFGRLVAMEPTTQRSTRGHVFWKCLCDCGNTVDVRSNHLQSGGCISCGCYAKDVAIRKALKLNNDNVCKRHEGTAIAQMKMKVPSHNLSSGVKGVSWDKSRQKWLVHITIKGTTKWLGRFSSKSEAIKIRAIAEETYFQPLIEKYEGEEVAV